MTTFKDVVKKLKLTEDYKIFDISHELWREYEHGDRIFRIVSPVALIFRVDGTTHRIVDINNVSHCHPIPGNGTALRWFNGTTNTPVDF